MATALITGITGQDGYYLTKRLLAEGSQVHGLVLPGEPVTDVPPDVVLHTGDLSDPDSITRAVLAAVPNEIYNLGGISSVAYSWQHPVLTGAVSGLGAVAVMAAAKNLQKETGEPVHVLQASSAEIFGASEQTPQTETTPLVPANPYGAAKAYAHQMARVFRDNGLYVTTAILYNHESPRRPDSFVTRKITAGVARIAHDGFGTLAMGNLDARRDWGWAPDYVDAMVRAIRYQEPEDFIVATGKARTVAEFVAAAFAQVSITDWRRHVEVDPQFWRPVDVATQVGDASKAQRLLGWQPTTTFDRMVSAMVDNDRLLLAGT